jgi:hypothetical protein
MSFAGIQAFNKMCVEIGVYHIFQQAAAVSVCVLKLVMAIYSHPHPSTP